MEAVWAFWRTRRLQRVLKTRADVTRWQEKQISRFRQRVLRHVDYYSKLADVNFADLPVIDKAALMGRYEAFNRLRLDAKSAWRIIETGGRSDGFHVGASTGTSGNRGLYVISESERWRWLGTMVAKTMPRLRRARVALILPLDSSLYQAAGQSFLTLRFFDLHRGIEVCGPEVDVFDPDTIIAPPKVLRWLAGQNLKFGGVRHVFSAAEVLDPMDREIIEARFSVTVREIYMATEGVLGVACEHGTLHLAEDAMRIELEPAGAGSDLVTPIITDFSRDTQAMVRYRMNDLLRLDSRPCPCGSPLQAIKQIEGRLDDMLVFSSATGPRKVTPDILRNAIVDADRRIDDFRLVQTGPSTVELSLAAALPDEAAIRAKNAVASLLQSLGVDAGITLSRPAEIEISVRKLRRVERRWRE